MNTINYHTTSVSKPILLIKNNKSPAAMTHSHKILDGTVTLYRKGNSGNNWSMSFWLRDEQRTYRKSLHTRSLDEAIQRGRETYLSVLSDIKYGKKVFSKTVSELAQEYIERKTLDAKAGIITLGRVSTITTGLNKWLVPFIGAKTKLENVKRSEY